MGLKCAQCAEAFFVQEGQCEGNTIHNWRTVYMWAQCSCSSRSAVLSVLVLVVLLYLVGWSAVNCKVLHVW